MNHERRQVNLSDEEISSTERRATHAIDIVAFVEADEIPLSCFETPYYLAPAPGGERVYALLREALNRTRKIGIAHVMIQTRRRLAALIPCGTFLMLNTLRGLENSDSLVGARNQSRRLRTGRLAERELAMAVGVVESMAEQWDDRWCTEGMAECPGGTVDAQGTVDTMPSEILRPRVRLPQPEVTADPPSPDTGPGDQSVYQAQRPSRPRMRPRRTYH